MKEYIKPEIICTQMECMQFIADSIHVSDEAATEEACGKEHDMSTTSLWEEVEEEN